MSLDPAVPRQVRYPHTNTKARLTRCADKRCKICPRGRVLFSTVSNTPYTFRETFTCTDTSLIYCIICSKCGKLYIGLTSKYAFVHIDTFPKQRGGFPCTATLPGNHMTSSETIGSFRWSTVSQMLYRNERLSGLGPYTHSSHMA